MKITWTSKTEAEAQIVSNLVSSLYIRSHLKLMCKPIKTGNRTRAAANTCIIDVFIMQTLQLDMF